MIPFFITKSGLLKSFSSSSSSILIDELKGAKIKLFVLISRLISSFSVSKFLYQNFLPYFLYYLYHYNLHCF